MALGHPTGLCPVKWCKSLVEPGGLRTVGEERHIGMGWVPSPPAEVPFRAGAVTPCR